MWKKKKFVTSSSNICDYPSSIVVFPSENPEEYFFKLDEMEYKSADRHNTYSILSRQLEKIVVGGWDESFVVDDDSKIIEVKFTMYGYSKSMLLRTNAMTFTELRDNILWSRSIVNSEVGSELRARNRRASCELARLNGHDKRHEWKVSKEKLWREVNGDQ